MIKSFKKEFRGDYGVKMTPGRLHTLCEVEWPAYGSWLATRGHNGLEDDKSSLCNSHRKTWTPRPVPIHRLLARADPRSPTMSMTLYSKWRRKKAQKLTDDKKEILQDPNEELPRTLYWMMNPPSNARPRPQDIQAPPLSRPFLQPPGGHRAAAPAGSNPSRRDPWITALRIQPLPQRHDISSTRRPRPQ